MAFETVAISPEYKDCLCPDCLNAFDQITSSYEIKNKTQSELSADDYTIDSDGLMVFTREYHIKRGHCCNSGCFNCPY
jgi:hypothetical protein